MTIIMITYDNEHVYDIGHDCGNDHENYDQ